MHVCMDEHRYVIDDERIICATVYKVDYGNLMI